MKKTILLTIALLLSTVMFAQTRATFVDESFNGSDLPSGWKASEVATKNWKISSTTYSGGDGKELMLAWSPAFEGTTRLITTPFNLSGIDEMTISFKHFFDNAKDNEFTHTIGIATSSDNGETWNIGWSEKYTKTDVYNVKANFKTDDMGKANVIFCLFYEGVSKEMDNWFFDDLLIYKQMDFDLRLVDINIPDIIETEEREISFTLQNTGLVDVESFEAKINVSNWETPITATFEQKISNSEIVTLTYKDKKFNAIAKNKPYLISVEIISINGNDDQDPSNNYIEKNVSVAFNKAQRIPMIEHFSSSTCGPCVAINEQMHRLTQNNEGRYTYTKYSTSGDPYNNFEVTHKVQEYGVVGVPNIFLDGRSLGSNYITQEMLDEKNNTAAYADIRGAFTIEDSQIYVTADFMSYVTLKNVVAYIVVNEKTTTKNIGSNGETEFHHVLMKMLKSKTGNPINIKAGEYQRLQFSHDMSLTNVEELGDLEVALWLQNPTTKEIYNSRFAYAYTDHSYPIQNLTLNQNEGEKTLTWEAPEQGNPTSYKIYVNGKLISENETTLSYKLDITDESFTAEVIAVYENDKTSVGVAKLFGVEEEDDEDDEEPENPIAAPNNLTAMPASTSSINLNWDAVTDAESYNIYREGEFVNNVIENSYIDRGLKYNTEYCYTVTALIDGKETGHSNEVCIKTLGESLEELTSSINIYPNPVNDRLYIETLTLTQTLTVEIYDVYGRRQVTETPSHQGNLVIDLSNLKSGIYFVKINTEKGNVVKRIIKD